MARILLNNVSVRLTAALATGGTTAYIPAADVAKFTAKGALSASNYVIATLVKVSGFREIAFEIVKITGTGTGTLTIVRAQESTTALALSIGDIVSVRYTAGLFDEALFRFTSATVVCESSSAYGGQYSAINTAADATGPYMLQTKRRGSGAAVNGDICGNVLAGANDGSVDRYFAGISYKVSGAISSGTVPINVQFYAGSTGLTLRGTLTYGGDWVLGTEALATNATAGFVFLPSCAGAPTGTPATTTAGMLPAIVDSTNNRLYIRVGSTWRYVTLT